MPVYAEETTHAQEPALLKCSRALLSGLGSTVCILFVLLCIFVFSHPPAANFWAVCHWLGQAFLCIFGGLAVLALEMTGGKTFGDYSLFGFIANRVAVSAFYLWLGFWIMDINVVTASNAAVRAGWWLTVWGRVMGFVAWSLCFMNLVLAAVAPILQWTSHADRTATHETHLRARESMPLKCARLLLCFLGTVMCSLFALLAIWVWFHIPAANFFSVCHWLGQGFLCILGGLAGIALELKGTQVLGTQTYGGFAANRLALSAFYLWLGFYLMNLSVVTRPHHAVTATWWLRVWARVMGFISWGLCLANWALAPTGRRGQEERAPHAVAAQQGVPAAVPAHLESGTAYDHGRGHTAEHPTLMQAERRKPQDVIVDTKKPPMHGYDGAHATQGVYR